MSPFVRVCRVSEAPSEGAKLVTLDQQEIAIIRCDGDFYAVENRCPHKGGPLGLGPVKNGIITCPWHRFRFELASGRSVTNQAMRAITYRVVVEQGELLLQTG
ncbi:MAG: Rieske (2Fe-2S) protein [Candidatus Binatia bacterium]